MSRSKLVLSLFAFAALAGCGAQADTSYPGQALATIQGNVKTSSTPVASASIDAAIVWAQVKFSADAQLIQSVKWVGESTPVTGQFPAAFQINVYEPPPDTALVACTTSPAHLAIGFIVAVNGTADLNHVDPETAVVGSASDYMLLYLDSDQAADWECLPGMGFTFAPTKGYHLMSEVPGTIKSRYDGARYPAYTEAPMGLATEVTVTLGSSQFGPSETEDCEAQCESKANSCAAPSSQSTPVCVSFCKAKPTDSQLSCVQTSSCTDLAAAYKNADSLCGVATVAANGSDKLPPTSPAPSGK